MFSKLPVLALLLLVSLMFAPASYASSISANMGLITKKSANSVKETIDILEKALKKKGIGVWARVDHKANGATVNESVRETTVLIFGNPRLGTPLMRSKQTIGIDLPMKALAWKDENGQVWLTYNDPNYLAWRHGITGQGKIVQKMSGALNKLSTKATTKK